MDFKIGVLPGDGIGPEIVEQAIKVLNAVGKNSITSLFTPMHLLVLLPLMSWAIRIRKQLIRYA